MCNLQAFLVANCGMYGALLVTMAWYVNLWTT